MNELQANPALLTRLLSTDRTPRYYTDKFLCPWERPLHFA